MIEDSRGLDQEIEAVAIVELIIREEKVEKETKGNEIYCN